MRPKYHVVMACIIVLLKSAAATTGGINRTRDPAINSITVSSRQEMNSSATPSFLTLHGSAPAAKVIAHGPRIDEERGLIDAPAVAEKVAGVALSAAEHLHPPKPLALLPVPPMFTEIRQTCANIAEWIKKADAHHAATGKFPDAAVLKGLLQSVHGKEKDLVPYLNHNVFSGTSTKSRVFALQKALGADLPIVDRLEMWRAAETPPIDVYELMSIGTEKNFLSDDLTHVLSEDAYNKDKMWLEYAHWYCTTTRYSPIVDSRPQYQKTSQDLLYQFTAIELVSEETTRLQKMLYVVFPAIREQLSEYWLASGTTPKEVFELMPISRHRLKIDQVLKSPFARRLDFEDWIEFNDNFMQRSIIFSRDDKMVQQREDMLKAMTADLENDAEPAREKANTVAKLQDERAVGILLNLYPLSEQPREDALVQLLLDKALAERVWYRALADFMMAKLPTEEAVTYSNVYGYHKNQWHAVTMQQRLLYGASLETEEAVFKDWTRLHQWADVMYDRMPFALEKQCELGELQKFPDRITNFKQWLRYVKKTRQMSNFDDTKVAKLLKEKGWTPEELDGLSKGIVEDSEWKNLADLLAKPVEANR